MGKNDLLTTALSYLLISIALPLFMTGTAASQPTDYEGFGAVTQGALDAPGGYTTYHVTSLADDGSPGTLRDAVSQGSRLIVFDVGGTITLSSSLNVDESYVTIDGLTAPSPGITIIQPGDTGTYVMPVGRDAHDIIVRYLRTVGPGESGAGDIWGLDGEDGHVYNIIIDHVTGIAAGDGVFDFYADVSNVTISWNVILDTPIALHLSHEDSLRERISFHHNVFARNNERQIRMRYQNNLIDFVNNVIHGWGYFEGGASGLNIGPNSGVVPDDEYPRLNVENNYYYYDSSSPNGDEDDAIRRDIPGKIYFNGNIFPARESDNYDTSTRHVIPAYAEVTKYDASTLGDTVVPYVGTHYPTQEEQDLLSEISIAIGGGQEPVLFLSSTIGGSVTNPGEGSFQYDEGTVVSIEATADNNYYFVNWTGDTGTVANANAASTTVTVDAAYTIQAVFRTDRNTLMISSTGGGSVTNPGEGSFPYDDATVVSIQATADENYHFVNWTGTGAAQVADPGSASTTMTMDADYTLQANFDIDRRDLTITSTSGGAVTTPGEATYTYDHGAAASVIAAPSADFHFVNWTGTAVDAGKVGNATAASTTVTMDAGYAIHANFAADQHTLTISSTSGGTVTDPGEGDFLYDHGIGVSIQATAGGGNYFVNWTGTAATADKVANPSAASTTVTVDAGYTVQANFDQQDGVAPTVANLSPAADSIQAPLNSLIILHVTDPGGVDAGTVEITLDGAVIYTDDTSDYSSATGICRRGGTPVDYTYAYQSNQPFDFDELKTVTVNAADLGGLVMTEQSYSFTTEMRSFGQNKRVSSGLDNLNSSRPVTVCDTDGNIWAVWHAGPAGGRNVYVAKLAAGADTFGASVQIRSNSSDQANPAIALGTDDKLYVVWQDNRQADDNNQGQWDIYVSTSVGGTSWSAERRVNDPNEGSQIYPAIVVDGQSPNYAHVVWQDGRAGNQDICIAASNDSFVTKTVSQPITSDTSNQTTPAIAVDSSNTVYVLWTDARNPTNGKDIYGASGSPWTNVPIVTKAAGQSSPAIAVESSGSILHMLWVDETPGDSDIYYASSDGLPGSPLTGSSLMDPGETAEQLSPAIAVTGSTGDGLEVFAGWRDERDTDTDLYMVQANPVAGLNVFVGDGGTNSDQTEPAMGIDQYGYPYIVWTDVRGTNTGIYYAGSNYMQPTPLVSGVITASSGGTIGTADVQSITDVDDVSIALPAGACPYDVTVSITRIENPPEYALGLPLLNGYEFSPSGLEFTAPVTITIPFAVTGAAGVPTVYWYDSLTAALSQQGIGNIEIIELTSSLHAIRFTTTHLTPYYALLGASSPPPPGGGDGGGDGGGGGGGCTLSNSREGSMLEYFLPYGVLAFCMLILKRRDRRRKEV